ncbi:MAG TPA: NAD+ synthase [Nitrospirota bacterium]|nr:NAD+ synthase [Nitrospirota bacterium]
MNSVRVGIAQINAGVGDLEGNVEKILQFTEAASRQGVDIVAFPELAVTGYPPEDLLLKPQFVEDNYASLERIAKKTSLLEVAIVVGFVDRGDDIYNAAAVISKGKIAGIYHKNYLPNYGVFDEKRYFKTGTGSPLFLLWGIPVGINICEDIWYPDGPCMSQALAGAQIIININSSPYHAGKWRFRERMISTRASDNAVFIAYANMVGGQDELVFDGQSMVFNPRGELIARGKQFEEDLIMADIDLHLVELARLHDPRRREKMSSPQVSPQMTTVKVSDVLPKKKKVRLAPRTAESLSSTEEVYQALVLGTRDYVRKNGFKKVVIGLSGGIDSSLVAMIAVDALGKKNVAGVFMPSQYTLSESGEDVQGLVKNLGIRLVTIPIQDIFKNYINTLSEEFTGMKPDVTEENIQARIRGNIMMALSNKFGWLVLTTGNKSEMSVGYATLYGDMAGGFAVIKDVPKTLVYELARYRNMRGKEGVAPIPERVLVKEPTAELRPGQKDTDSLPPYETLDPILHAYVEEDRSVKEIAAMGYREETVARVVSMVDRSEYKRRQAPPGIKITPRAFGKDWRVPITNRYRR